MLLSDTPLIVTFDRKVWLVTPEDFVNFHLRATQIFTECFSLVHIQGGESKSHPLRGEGENKPVNNGGNNI